MALFEALALGASVGADLLSASGSRSQARRNRRESRRQFNESMKFAREQFDKAVAQLDFFSEPLRSSVDFLNENTFEDIASGKAVSPGVQRAVRAINLGAQETNRLVNQNLSQRGIANDDVASLTRSQVERNRIGDIADVSQAGVQQDFNNRLQLSNIGLGQAAQTTNSSLPVTNLGANRANSLLSLAQQQNQSAASAGASGLAGLTGLGIRLDEIIG
jgi:hypothetical protein